jgi:hypothetical protein
LPIQILVTEESRGLWKERIIGPNWLIVDSLNVKSLPPDEYPVIEERKIQFMVGTSYYAPLNTMKTGSVGIGVGMSLVDRHYFIVGANTNQEVGLSYYYKFKTTKRKK